MNIIENYLSRDEWTFEQCISDSFIDPAGVFLYGRLIERVVLYAICKGSLHWLKTLLQKISLGGLIDDYGPAINEIRELAFLPRLYEPADEAFSRDVARQLSDGLVLYQPDIGFNEHMQYAIQFADVEHALLF